MPKKRTNKQENVSKAGKRRKAGHDDTEAPPPDHIGESSPPRQSLSRDHYTVGWICAINTEYVAAQLFLDEEHEQLDEVTTHDSNHYTLGKVGEHNVVIAVLPCGQYGTTSAAAVGRDMLRSFPNVRISLMVGIGGGAPSDKHDIRLGDIVVSIPVHGKNAVSQYEFSQTIQDQNFQLTRFLDKPPLVLLEAVNDLMGKASLSIHYGLIASGNQLLKNAELRDKFANEMDTLCFEVEAAGLGNQFPCLVIRGICDYSDTHKNKEWQGYAAIAAAAYAKDLLCQIAPNRVEAERRIRDVLISMEINQNQSSITVKDSCLEHKQKDIKRWLSPPDPSENYYKARRQRHSGSGRWFLGRDDFFEWKTRRNSFLWLTGIPGCGKTILSSTIIKHLDVPSSRPLLYFYFDLKDAGKQTLDSMIRSLINQLYDKRARTREHLDFLFSSSSNKLCKPTCESLCEVLLQMIEQAKEVWIILDALDECCTRKGPPTEGLLSWIKNLLQLEQTNVHVLVTSRPGIKSEAGELAHDGVIVPIRSDLIAGDIRAYVQTKIGGVTKWESHPEVRHEIEVRLMDKAHGMFLLAALQFDTLVDCPDLSTLQKALKTLPKTLKDAYTKILRSIPALYKPTAIRILQLLTFSERSLTVKEAIDAIAVDLEKVPHFNPSYRMFKPAEILCYCSSLVVVVPVEGHSHGEDNERQELQIAHPSVKEYLRSTKIDSEVAQDFQEIHAKASIATVCLGYLLHLDMELPTEEIRVTFPFAQYCATYWMTHAVGAEDEDETLQGFIQKFCNRKGSYKNCYNLYRLDHPWDKESINGTEEPPSALYYASYGGLVNTVEYLLIQGADVNSRGGEYGNALQAATHNGHDQIVQRLLEKGADVNAVGGRYGVALFAASWNGHDQIVQRLLEKGADVNVQGGFHGNALQAASYNGHDQIVQRLLEKGADVNAKGGRYASALYAASSSGHDQIVKRLLEKGADIEVPLGMPGDALEAASYNGHSHIIRRLLRVQAQRQGIEWTL